MITSGFRFSYFLCILIFLNFALKSTFSETKTKPHSDRYEKHAHDLIASASEQMQHIWNRKRDLFLSSNKREYNLNLNLGIIDHGIDNDYRHLLHNLANNLSTIPITEIKNQTLRRQVKLLSKLQLYGLNSEDYEKAKDEVQKMKGFLFHRLVCPYYSKDTSDCHATIKELPMTPNIQRKINKINNIDELNYYWKQWRQMINENRAKNTFEEYIVLFQKAAALNGHVTPSRTWYLGFETENFKRELEDVIWEIMPLYKELHAYVRYIARTKYGERLTSDDGAIPAPVMEQIIQQAWLATSILITPYPNKELPPVQRRLEEMMEKTDRLMKKSAEYFESLGLNQISNTFYEKFTRRVISNSNNNINTMECKSDVLYFPPDVGLRYCTELGYKELMQMHGHMAQLQYNLYRRNLPFGLDGEPCPGFASAVAETAVVASGTPRHLYRLRVLAEESLGEKNSMNRLFRMAVHTVLAIPQYFVHDRFIADVLDRRIDFDHLNCGYWKLQYKYAGVVPPEDRTNKQFDPDSKFYRGLISGKSSIVKFLSEVLGLQLYRSFCLASNQYHPGDPNYPLNNCDYYNSTQTGKIIKEMMELGATRHWRDVLFIATGERKISSIGVMEYFAPLYHWLKKRNEELGLDVGWDSEIKCVGN